MYRIVNISYISNSKRMSVYCYVELTSPHLTSQSCRRFPQLDNELFCGSYYLRHLCDVVKFPDWSIREPVSICQSNSSFLHLLLLMSV